MTQLKFVAKEMLPKWTEFYQMENGAIFCHDLGSSMQRLHVTWQGRGIEVKLPRSTIITCPGIHDNALYFMGGTIKKIFKAVFYPPSTINVSLCRDLLEGEQPLEGGLCSLQQLGVTKVYRMNENPYRDGVKVDVSQAELDGMRLRGVHRGYAYFSSRSSRIEPMIRNLSENIIVIKSNGPVHIGDDESPFVYASNGVSLFTLDTESMRFLPKQSTGGTTVLEILGEQDGVMSVVGRRGEERQLYLMTASVYQ
ncbi:hypothetical protein PMAYCL1PPCAC_08265 [Pristionchus mayeri]|uniref:Uncharacterized protein n=1 Tax=Pristionchus mayeri TaxID=1317129 RepID=A0AAN4ZJD8_9BILA|nr:hypothetical protein PMAYCL1PPCAC_08265 [Pristionchus mayeri]